MVVVVEGLAVNGGDHRKGDPAAGRHRDPLDLGGDLRLPHPRPRHPHGRGVHVHRGVDGLFDLDDFLVGLERALVDHRADEFDRGVLGKGGEGEAQQPREQNRVVGPVGRQEAHRPARGHGRLHDLGQRRPRPGVGHAHPFGPFGDGGQVAHPHDVVDGQLVAEDDGRALVDVDHRRQVGLVETEVVEEGTVLPEGVAVVGVVHRALGVAREHQQTVVEPAGQNRAALFIGRA